MRQPPAATSAVKDYDPAPLTESRQPRHELLTVASLLFVALLAGLLLANDYGASADEPENAAAGLLAANAYTGLRGYSDYMLRGEVLGHHGPAYFMPWQAAARRIARLVPGWMTTDARHFINYVVFLLGLWIFFRFASRFMDRQYALMTTLLLGTQPLLLGHGFINQKDTPFWVLTLAGVAAGMTAVDAASSATPLSAEQIAANGASSDHGLDRDLARTAGKSLGLLLILASALATADILSFELGFHTTETVLRQAHAGQAQPPLNQLYRLFAQQADQAPVDIYLPKLKYLYWLLRAPLFALSLLLGALGWRLSFPDSWRRVWRRYRRAGLQFILAGALLGFAIAIRPIAAIAAVLVGLYWLLRGRLQAAGLAIPYAATASITAYASWPYLWDAPYRRLAESLLFTGQLDRTTRYLGQIIATDSLPWHYFPVYLTTELTEPTLLLLLLGIVLVVRSWRWRKALRPSLTVLLFWIALPLFGLVALGMGVYDNLRHLLFVLIPVFVIAGAGLQWTMERLPTERLRLVLLVLLLSPGMLANVRLHPYQYSYFNTFTGGVKHAADLHLLDRWCLSYREAMEFINHDAGPHARVAPLRQMDAAQPFARQGIEVVKWDPAAEGEIDYALTCSFEVGDSFGGETWQRVFVIERDGAVFSEVYKRTEGSYPGSGED